MAIFDVYNLTLGVIGFVVFLAAKGFLNTLRKHEPVPAPSGVAVMPGIVPSEGQRFISAKTRGFNLPSVELTRLAVVVPEPSLLFGDLDQQGQTTLREAYNEGQSRGPEATAFLSGAPLSGKNALYLAWFKDYRLPHFFVDKYVALA